MHWKWDWTGEGGWNDLDHCIWELEADTRTCNGDLDVVSGDIGSLKSFIIDGETRANFVRLQTHEKLNKFSGLRMLAEWLPQAVGGKHIWATHSVDAELLRVHMFTIAALCKSKDPRGKWNAACGSAFQYWQLKMR